MKGIRLTAKDIAGLEAAQRALLSPLAHEDPEAWQLRANAAVRHLLDADHSVFSVPDPMGPGLVSDDTDPAFPERLLGYFAGVEDGEYRFRDPYIENAGRLRRTGGTGAYHERMLGSRDDLDRSPAYQEVFVPAGLTHMIGFSTPLAVGEATQFFSFEGPDPEGRSARGMALLHLLVPSFEAGVRVQRQLSACRAAFVSALERLGQAAALFSTGGVPLHRSRALSELLAEDGEAEALWQSVSALARGLAPATTARRDTGTASEPLPDARGELRTGTGEYRLLGSYLGADLLGCEAVVVTVERVRPLMPSAAELRARFPLTAREAEVALLLAEGLTAGAIACRLDLSPHTARRYCERVLAKLGVHSRAAVALRLLRGP